MALYVGRLLEQVAESYGVLRDRIRPPKRWLLEEGRDGQWHQAGRVVGFAQAVPTGADVTLVLDPSRFLVLTLSLPVGAKPYLRGVVASQIDRISPWSADHALFGAAILSETAQALNVRIAIAAREEIARRLADLQLSGARSVTLRVATQADDGSLTIDMPFERDSSRAPMHERRAVQAIFFGTIALLVVTELARFGFGSATDTSLRQIRNESAKLRETLAGTIVGGDMKGDPLARMVNAKTVHVPTVEVLDALAGAVPDHTYLTAFEIEPAKIHIEGISTAVTDLPKSLGDNPLFGDVTFSAPTAKRRDGAGETFQIDIAVKARQAGEP